MHQQNFAREHKTDLNKEQNCRKWIDLPQDLTVSILSRLGVIEILKTVPKVCKTWRRFCMDPMMWRTIDMCCIWAEDDRDPELWKKNERKMEAMCCHAVGLSRGVVVDIQNFGTHRLLRYITNSCKGIRRLRLVLPYIKYNGLVGVASKLPLLKDLEISYGAYTTKDLEAIGRCCPLLKSLKLNKRHGIRYDWDGNMIAGTHHHHQVFTFETSSKGKSLHDDDDALAIAGTMHGLRQLQIVGNRLTSKGLKAILDGCPCLESLDLRRCFNLEVKGDFKTRCFIKQLRLPYDSTNDYELVALDEIVYNLY